MIIHTFQTGTSGEIRIEDNTDDVNSKMVNVFIRSTTPVAVSQMPWAWELGIYSPNPEHSGWRSLSGVVGESWRQIASIFVAEPNTFTVHLGNTNTDELGGPDEFTVDLYGFDPEVGIPPLPRLATVYIDGVPRQAEVYVYDDGWPKLAEPYIRRPFGWVKAI